VKRLSFDRFHRRRRRVDALHELRSVLPAWNHDLDLVCGALAAVVFLQFLAEMMSVDANHGVLLRVELGVATEHLESNRIFCDFAALSVELFVT
jgi:hypothetical protein